MTWDGLGAGYGRGRTCVCLFWLPGCEPILGMLVHPQPVGIWIHKLALQSSRRWPNILGIHKQLVEDYTHGGLFVGEFNISGWSPKLKSSTRALIGWWLKLFQQSQQSHMLWSLVVDGYYKRGFKLVPMGCLIRWSTWSNGGMANV